MYLDADDLVHRDLVKYVLDDDNRVGYLIESGYALDYIGRQIAPIPGVFSLSFSRVCGSSGIPYLQPEDFPSSEYGEGDGSSLFEKISNHKYFRDGTFRDGEALKVVPFPAAVYTLNNSLNLSNKLVRDEPRQLELIQAISRLALTDVSVVAEDFGLKEDSIRPAPSSNGAVSRDEPVLTDEQVVLKHRARFRILLEYVSGTGWLRSTKSRHAVGADGSPLPDYTYPATSFLASRLGNNLHVFEYGSGNSTRWWASIVGTVTAVEHDATIIAAVSDILPANATLVEVGVDEDGDYCRAIVRTKILYDVIVVGGRDRINCAKHAVQMLKPGGVVIWDNTERRKYHAGFEPLFSAGFKRIEFRGLAPSRGKALETSIFYRSENCLGI